MFDVANMSFNAIPENKVIANFSGFTSKSILTQIYVFLVFLFYIFFLFYHEKFITKMEKYIFKKNEYIWAKILCHIVVG